ncbi:hypothetical protein ACG33_14410 [Steroidobacter denitrificans]|uniref:Uncharacterized protein n=1 Tax=Steroidobacter denitrificans TaxID=465721 RepID=A0A127FEE2_STEDE|nr:hypothetical protein [Steroidobacter denitrificans]AMN48269.1 hypothetical protein ACG33_14410 [Steroidobacter denitrificans]
MDQNGIRDGQVIDRYLSGELTMREAREFEQYCLDHPEVLKDMPIPIRLKARLSRHPHAEDETGMFPATPSGATHAASDAIEDDFDSDEEGQTTPRLYRCSAGRFMIVALVTVMLLAIAAAISQAMKADALAGQIEDLQRAHQSLKMQAPGSVQTYRLQPTQAKPQHASLNIGRPVPPQWMELHVDVSTGKYTQFQITIDESETGRVMQMKRVARDSNHELRLALNSSAFAPGNYLLKIDGYTWRGQLEHVGWLRLDLR